MPSGEAGRVVSFLVIIHSFTNDQTCLLCYHYQDTHHRSSSRYQALQVNLIHAMKQSQFCFFFVLSGHRMQSACISLVSFRIQDSGYGLHRCGNKDHGGLSLARTYPSPSGHAPAAIWICGHQGLSVHSILVILFKRFISNRGRTSLTAEREVAGSIPGADQYSGS